jgi:N-acyl-phosphatidylethanolamine-hydrolysing phospholipase D
MRHLHGALLLATLALAAPVSGCAVGTVLASNTAAFFATPAPVLHRVDHPFRADARLAVLWIGHASALVQIDDKLILTDPVFTDTVGQFSRRLVEPGLLPEALPRVDAVLISHMHFDHLSPGSLEMIQHKVGFLVVPQKGTVCIPDLAFETVELPTWTTFERGGLRITAVPVQHSGFRWAIDGSWMDTSYTGYVIEYHGITVYFGGDTGYAGRWAPRGSRASRCACWRSGNNRC